MSQVTDTIDLGSYLRQRGRRLTNPRRFVWDVLAAARGHRSLTLFAELGLARESNLGTDGAGRWEVAHPDDEFHLICDRCGDVQHHGGDLVEQVRAHLGSNHGFQAAAIELSVTGMCSACAN